MKNWIIRKPTSHNISFGTCDEMAERSSGWYWWSSDALCSKVMTPILIKWSLKLNQIESDSPKSQIHHRYLD